MKLARPLIKTADTSIARTPAKRADPHYLTTNWKALRKAVFDRDHWTCVVPGCRQRAIVCEHICSRRKGGTDDMANLASLCRDHDNRFKELPSGARRNSEEWERLFAPKG
ncbi:HNH endonuclease [Methylovirgula ligni]|uniref:HNH nuclease domain-containing protein n=1 Tax=Methylovirgula ligni TaxID=569860 RepID=A0A3D9YL51_9HYPH|nr:HNH endonuclease signature motif containing protein [Methylovirgula ligni]QAY96694.1 HNH endonuclease [Methylovirgula ligni]REF83264.1 hypothetical protein DES32_3180 [Methylovirgula ligni]